MASPDPRGPSPAYNKAGEQAVRIHSGIIHKICQPANLQDASLRILAKLIEIASIDAVFFREIRQSVNDFRIFERVKSEEESPDNSCGV